MYENYHPLVTVTVADMTAEIDETQYDIPEITRRLTEHAAGRLIPPAPTDWSTVGR
jgi:hypothetical protein